MYFQLVVVGSGGGGGLGGGGRGEGGVDGSMHFNVY